MKHIAHQIHEHIKKAKKVVIVPHQNPDGDAIGAATAFHEYLKTLKKDGVIFCITTVGDKLHFVPHSTVVVQDPTIFEDPKVDTVVLLDSGDLRYAGVEQYLANHSATIINIDHHATNEYYGHINLVIPTAASTTEILHHFFRHNNIVVNQRMATSLLTGLTTDTGNFSNAATSATALSVGGELLRSGGNLNLINNAILKNKSIDSLRLWGKVLSRLNKDERTEITYTYITIKDLDEHKVSENESEGIANFLNNLENTKIALILKEIPGGKVKGSFRTTQPNVDVSELAKKLGGGGHKKAAGFTMDGDIEEALKKILHLSGNGV
ncbi:MAG TPA: DHH family phosphoesterase [Patescibacteria group bacterium]|nr:DHH family phosphoesterase [Patescibacteria group bacterium]